MNIILGLQETSRIKIQSNEEGGEPCAICLDDFEEGKEVTKLICGHYYCKQCIKKWFDTNVSYPNCRKDPNLFL